MGMRSRKIMFPGSRVRPVRRANNLTAICEPIVYTEMALLYFTIFHIATLTFTWMTVTTDVGVGLVLGFTGSLQTLTTSNYRGKVA
jgi:hypothetical protein